MKIKNFINRKINSQLIKRKHDKLLLTLKHQNLYVLPSKLGWLFILFSILIFLLGSNYQNNLIILTSYILLSIVLVSVVQGYLNLSDTKIEFVSKQNNYLSAGYQVNLALSNPHKLYNLVIESEDSYPILCPVIDQNKTVLTLTVKPAQRGKYPLPRIKLYSRFPFGFVTVWSYVLYDQNVFVYPDPIAISFHRSNQTNDTGEGDLAITKGNDDFEGVKTFQKGDNFARISWKHYAKQHELMAKQFNNLVRKDVMFDLQLLPDNFETKLQYLSFLVTQAHQEEVRFGIKLPKTIIEPNQGFAHLTHCLEKISEA